MIPKSLAALGLTLLALAGTGLQPSATASASSGAAATTPKLNNEQTVSSNGPAVCNCTSSNAQLSVCQAEQVDVRLGGDVFSVSTGSSSSSCGMQSVAPGNCLYFRYSFQCCYRGFFVGWECHLNSAGLRERPADPETDC